jgi:putative PIN family toxin of toxin-antitoxin system
MRLVLDTNILIGFLISENLAWIDPLLRSDKTEVLMSEALLIEFMDVASRPKFARFFTGARVRKLVGQLNDFGAPVQASSKLTLCRDPKDNFLLELALDGQADFLVTGDADLLSIGKIGKCNIITLAKLKEEFAKG